VADYEILVLPGDGIGPEVTAEGVRLLEAVGERFEHSFRFTEDLVGGAAIDAHGIAIRDETIERAQASDAVLWGAVGGPKWDDPTADVRPEQGLLRIRRDLGLWANLRPVTVEPALVASSPLRAELLEGVDLLVVRELTSGAYFGKPAPHHRRPPRGRRHDLLQRRRDRPRRAPRLRAGARASRQAALHRQGERAGVLAAVARGRH
jgi:3-isopropylmalate dehydrogenase